MIGVALLAGAGAAVALVLGWSGNDPALVWVSLAMSVLAAALVFAAARSFGSESDAGDA